MNPRCPKCESVVAYTEGGNYVCMMAGHRWPINGVKPIVVYKSATEENMEGISPSGKTGTCSNCGRTKFIADKHGHCTTCRDAVKGVSVGSTEYSAALAEVKTRLADPNFKRGGNRRGADKKSVPVAQKNKRKKTVVEESRYDEYVQQCREDSSLPISHESFNQLSAHQKLNMKCHPNKAKDAASINTALDMMIDERNQLQDSIFNMQTRVTKLNKAIEILSA